MFKEEYPIQTFVHLGLTNLQARVYMALVKIGAAGANARKIASVSSIARQDVYRILPTLEKLGLVEKIIANPAVFKPISIETALSMLMQKKSEEYIEIQKGIEQIIQTFNVEKQPEASDDNSQFIITSERKLFLKKLRDDVAEAQTSIDIIYRKQRMATVTFTAVEELVKAMDRGVRIRAVTTREQDKPLDTNTQKLLNRESFKIRYIPTTPVGLVIIDGKEVNIRTTDASDKIVPSLWTNNRSVVRLAQIYFESMWTLKD